MRGVVGAHRLLTRLLAQRDPSVLGQCAGGVRLLGAQLAEVGAAHGAVEDSLAVLLAPLITCHRQLQQEKTKNMV